MIGEIIETTNRDGEVGMLEVIADVKAPEEISAFNIEIIPFPVPRMYSPDAYFECVDARDYLYLSNDMYFGLSHAKVLLKNAWRIPEEWKVFTLYFPGTILWRESEGPHMPFMEWRYQGWTLGFRAFFRMTWSMKKDRFVRWRR